MKENRINVINRNGVLIVDSKEVALNFNKNHSNVIKKIEGVKEDLGNLFNQVEIDSVKLNEYFIEDVYIDEKGELRKKYYLTNKGFDLVALSFIGEKALLYKVAYIEEFHRMQGLLKQSLNNYKTYINDNRNKLEFIEHTEEESSNYTNDIGELANIISDKGIKIGRNKLFSVLREKKILKKDNSPYQTYIDREWFVVKRTYKVDSFDVEHIYNKTFVTVRGQLEIFKMLKEKMNYGFGTIIA